MTNAPDNQNQMDSVSKENGQQIRVSKIWQKGHVSSPFTPGYKANQAPVPSTPPTPIYFNFYQLQLITRRIWVFYPISCSHTQVWYSNSSLSHSTFARTPLCLPSILTLVQTRKHFYSQVHTPRWHKQKRYNQIKRNEGKMQQPGGQEKRKVT